MNIADVKKRIEEIKSHRPDYERMHGMEDDLMKEFIHSLADGLLSHGEAIFMAIEIKKISEINFPRHCS